METDPLKPGHIRGQNPNTPERLQGEMKVGAGSQTPRLLATIGIPLAVLLALIAIYTTMNADPGSRPANDPQLETKAP
jgi:hypothetical protein